MWGSNRKSSRKPEPATGEVARLTDALRQARIETAERTGVVVDLRDAEVARLEILNEALDPIFAEVPQEVDIFDRGISRGDTPRLWIDMVAFVMMGRDKRIFRFVQDTRFGRKILAESAEAPEIVSAVTRYVARRLVERERMLADDGRTPPSYEGKSRPVAGGMWPAVKTFAAGLLVGIGVLIAVALIMSKP